MLAFKTKSRALRGRNAIGIPCVILNSCCLGFVIRIGNCQLKACVFGDIMFAYTQFQNFYQETL
jgi:hypothetical protein